MSLSRTGTPMGAMYGPPASGQDRHRSVQVAAFDFDGTLTRGGSVWRFLVAMVGMRRFVRAALPLLWRFVPAAVLGGSYADNAKEALFRRTLRGEDSQQLAALAARFGIDHYRRRARQDVRARLEWHRAHGHLLLLVSASPRLYVAPVGEELAMDGVVATSLEVGPDGRLTGGYDGRNCRGRQKIEGVREWMEQSRPTTPADDGAAAAPGTDPDSAVPYLWAYGNSAGDAELLEGADVGVDAGRLGRFGKLRKFPRLSDLPA